MKTDQTNLKAGSTRPNIILILVDDMGYSDIGCYGSEVKTPNLDRLARQGMRFSSMYNAARCCPTRASLLTGCYPHKAGIGHMIGDFGIESYRGRLLDENVTIAEALKSAGYDTLMSGKWHVGGDYDSRFTDQWNPGDEEHPVPLQRGFDRFYGLLDGASSYFNPHFIMEDTKRVLPDCDDYYATDAFSRKAVDMIRDQQSSDNPFFLYLAYTAPHWPLHAPEEDIAKYEGSFKKGWDYHRGARMEELKASGILKDGWNISPRDPLVDSWEAVSDKSWEDRRMAVYAAQVELLDKGVGQVLDELDRLEIADDTVIMFLSDNGGCAELLAEDGWARFYAGKSLDGRDVRLGNRTDLLPGDATTFMSYDRGWSNLSNAPFRLHKRFVHEGGISTPFIVRWPGEVEANSIAHKECHVMDVLPTLLDILGVSSPTERAGLSEAPKMDGESFLGCLQGRTEPRQTPIFWEHQGNAAIRNGEWKLVKTHGGDWELYNMDDDRTEIKNLVEGNESIRERLLRDYNAWAEYCDVRDWVELEKMFQTLYPGSKLH
ncbi:arylsulfatase [Shimia sediminis]|uniref:arylsulfatase n=1 Tax=Shimia sediminis TaxID=2497945 RepID=UPI000F8DF9BC|nr:arylsulfatase [Shimia sediminis]